ncbi:hypothetical protein PP175_29270 (plasmid) [Aneurinibacillus sp. Ricciae_BoGa-3]|uniref:hypothetical protein n=1 Tax=Aneurinibacillus sp. Ricciae_BoGa-3 TaxID=3022697 RepID=UPI0023406D9B|nr:hypothetical protein [Aneurinibacillus sp. Ricciae_BoGa-3]WCK57283.1 hypothetical protein PP175_29270 [Aneurinibacillus sp. Ricciae_BoGa-3]
MIYEATTYVSKSEAKTVQEILENEEGFAEDYSRDEVIAAYTATFSNGLDLSSHV